ncbi:cysteine desulfurase-like protein [Williamsia maris]|uniref:Cysteine desulfurase family protein, VC1184 subfamily n=1 Tax=Williamsia maris TaxID=72806 RepID=A0ABT1HJ72_9NOCA|nr:cysteine desulfurase-like protein [Williamsia maris]MCP2177985.1 cysteine desulfurase family protein, VC1184 subfamily [Williamsia maris]
MAFDVAAVRAQFPALKSGIAHFDGPGGTQTPSAVADAITHTLLSPLSNRGPLVASERNAEGVVEGFRLAFADLLGVSPGGIVIGRSATQIAYDVSRVLAKSWGPGDEIVVSRLDHDSNVRPWVQAAEAVGARVVWLPLDAATADLDLSGLDEVITDRTRLVAVTAASNLLGTKPPVARIARRAHEVGALVYVDGVHHAAHSSVDVGALGADFFTCSPYKFFGPHCGVLAADPGLLESLHPDKLIPSTNRVPERFELGTLPYEIMAGATAAVDFIAGIGPDVGSRREQIIAAHRSIDEHEVRLRRRVEDGFAGFGDRVRCHSVAGERTPTLFFTFDGIDAAEVYRFLAARDVLAPAGSFYAHEAIHALDLGTDTGLRVGLAAYNDDGDIDRLLSGVADHLRGR